MGTVIEGAFGAREQRHAFAGGDWQVWIALPGNLMIKGFGEPYQWPLDDARVWELYNSRGRLWETGLTRQLAIAAANEQLAEANAS